MGSKRVYLCEDSIEGIFTAIYQAWDSRNGHSNNRIKVYEKEENYELFTEYIQVISDEKLAWKVRESIKKKIGFVAYEIIYFTAISDYEDKADLIYRFMILGFQLGKNVINYLSEDSVNKAVKLRQKVWYEQHHYLGFLRFEELENHILCAKITPRANVITLLAPHFSDRLANHDFMIIDERRGLAVIHPANKMWFLASTTMMNQEDLSHISRKERELQETFRVFVNSISIKERENKQLQQNNCPLRYREYMPEFK